MDYIQPVPQVNYGKALLQGLQGYQATKGIQQQNADQEAKTAERFAKERALTASAIEGKPLDFQKQHLSERIEKIKKRGGDPSNTQGLFDMLNTNDPGKIKEANFYISQAREQGQTGGHLPKQTQPKYDAFTSKVMAVSNAQPGTPEFLKVAGELARKSQGAVTNIRMGTGQNEFEKQMAKSSVGRYEKVLEAGDVAQGNLASLDILDSAEVQTGKMEPFKQSIAAWGESMGMDTSSLANVPAGQAFAAESSKVVLNAMKDQKGPQTESDMKQIRTTVSNLGNTPEANKFINNAARATSLRSIEKRDFYNNYADEKGNLTGVSKAWNEFGGNAPLVSKFKNQRTGLPIFFHEFERDTIRASEAGNAKQEGFTPTRKQIITDWKKRNRSFKKQAKTQPKIQQAQQPQQPYPSTDPDQYLQRLGVGFDQYSGR